MKNIQTIITGSGHYLPKKIVKNSDFLQHHFVDHDKKPLDKENEEIISKFQQITGIEERRYVDDKDLNTSHIGAKAAKIALEEAGIEGNDLDYIIAAHNFGDVSAQNKSVDIMPSVSAKIKNYLGISNPRCIPYDMIFGCPGWIQGMILGDQLIKSGQAKKILVIGTETLSRKLDDNDRDSMIFADGAGATIIEGKETDEKIGIIAHSTLSHQMEELNLIFNEESLLETENPSLHMRMKGRKVYEYAISNVPAAMKETLDKAGIDISDLNKLLIHQANEKMDDAMLNRLYRLYKIREIPENIMPMTIQKFGNSSVATVPTLYDRIVKGEMSNHNLNTGDNVLMASVGAGMHINAMLYRMP